MIKKFTNIQLENLVLGNLSVLSNPNDPILIDAMDRLHVTSFTGTERKTLFNIMVNSHVNGKDIADYAIMMDIHSINPELMYFLADLKPDRVEKHCLHGWIEELNALRLDRGHLNIIEDIRKDFINEPIRDARNAIISTFTDKVINLHDMSGSTGSSMRTSSECVDDIIQDELNGEERIKTGLKDLDSFLQGGFDPASLVVIGGAPSAGKTHLALKMLLECHKLQKGKEALVFSLEGKGTSVTKRLISHHFGAAYKAMPSSQKQYALNDYRNINITVSDKQNLSLEQIHSMCKRAKIRNNISVVLVDYLDRVKKPKGEMRQDEKLAEIANGLANIAIEMNCIVILTTQLNKEAIKRPDHRPSPVDSKNSSGQAEAASYWLGVKRISQWDEGIRYADSHLVELIIGKNRNDELEGIVYFQTQDGLYFDVDQDLARNLVKEGNQSRNSEKKPFKDLFNRGEKS